MSATEEWRIAPSLPEYEVSSLGRIRRIPHFSPMPGGGERIYGGKVWLGCWEPKQKRYILMYRGKTYKVARLVCEAFHGVAPPNLPYVLHLDEDSRNNRASNLKWGTQKENLNMPAFIQYCRSRTGENSPAAKSRNKYERD